MMKQTETILMFVCPCIVSIIVIDDQQDENFWFIYLFIPNQLYMFRAMFSPIHYTSRQQHRWTTSEAVNTVK